LKWNSADESLISVGPVGISHEHSQDGAAEKLPSSADLWGDRELSQPAVKISLPTLRRHKSLGVVSTPLKSQGNVLSKENFRPHSDRSPIVEAMPRLAVTFPLKNKDRHDCKTVVRLKQQMLRNQ